MRMKMGHEKAGGMAERRHRAGSGGARFYANRFGIRHGMAHFTRHSPQREGANDGSISAFMEDYICHQSREVIVS